MKAPALEVTREYSGLGDWLMTLAVLKHVNVERPDVAVHVSFRARREPMIAAIPQAFMLSDVKYSTAVAPLGCMKSGHLVYGRNPDRGGYVEDMVRVLNTRTGLALRYRPQLYPTFQPTPPIVTGGPVLMCSHGKQPHAKDPGFAFFDELAAGLAVAGLDVVQIGATGDRALRAASRRVLGQPLDRVIAELRHCALYVGLCSGPMVLAGFLCRPQVTFYNGEGQPERLSFAKQLQVVNKVDAGEALQRVLACI